MKLHELNIHFTPAFEQNRHDLPALAEVHGFLGEVLVQGTRPFRMALPMQYEMPLEDILRPALAEAGKRHCIVDKIVFTGARVLEKGEKLEASLLPSAGVFVKG